MEKPQNLFIVFDTKTKSLLSIFDDEKQQTKYLRKLILNDIQVEKSNLEMKILETNDKEEAQKMEMMIVQLEQQESLKDLRCYSKDDKVIHRYYTYMKPMNCTKSKIFFYN
jgi:hypothetical protein